MGRYTCDRARGSQLEVFGGWPRVASRNALPRSQGGEIFSVVVAPTLTGDPASSSASASSRDQVQRSDSAKKQFRILIADDHEAVRRGLRSALAGAGWQVCGEALDGREAIQQTKTLKPDLVILDISMPNLSGLDAAREILKSATGTKVLIFTMHESKQIRDETAAIGVHGLAVKSAPLSTLLATIDSLLRPN